MSWFLWPKCEPKDKNGKVIKVGMLVKASDGDLYYVLAVGYIKVKLGSAVKTTGLSWHWEDPSSCEASVKKCCVR